MRLCAALETIGIIEKFATCEGLKDKKVLDTISVFISNLELPILMTRTINR